MIRLRVLAIATVCTMTLVWAAGRPLAVVPDGMVALELAGSQNAATKIVNVWKQRGLIGRARLSVELDYLFLISYGTFLTMLVRRMRWTSTAIDVFVAYMQTAAAACDGIENIGLLAMLSDRPMTGAAAMTQGFATTKFLFIGVGLAYLIVGAVLTWAQGWRPATMTRIHRTAMTFSDLRPSFVFGALMVYLPLTAIDHVPGWALFGNLFVGYTFSQSISFGIVLCGSMVTLMITSALGRDIQTRLRRDHRMVFPISTATALSYLPLAAPAVAVVTAFARPPVMGLLGIVVGASLAAAALMAVTVLLFPTDALLTWIPPAPNRDTRLSRTWHGTVQAFGRRLRGVWLSDAFFDRDRLRAPHVYGFTLLVGVTAVYVAIYFLLKYERQTRLTAHTLPSAVYLYLLFVPSMWLVSFFWLPLRRYRLALFVIVAFLWVMYGLGDGPLRVFGSPAHTYDVFDVSAATTPLTATDVLTASPFQIQKPRTLIVIAASGGGVVASAWTAKVVSELAAAYPAFTSGARIFSAVSGGSVAAAHYVSTLAQPVTVERLRDFLDASMTSSLPATAYGLAFADLRRALFPIWVSEWFDRGRLLEADWRALGNRLRMGQRLDDAAESDKSLVLVSDWRPGIRTGELPAVIFNTTVMETGERVAITPISDLTTTWPLEPTTEIAEPERFHYPRVLGQFLGAGDTVSVDVWTAARLSATFAYISPAARASHAYRREDDYDEVGRRCPWNQPGNVNGCWQSDAAGNIAPPVMTKAGLQHLIDGGYHDNYGVGSALNWLNLALGSCEDPLFDRVALIEIRARPGRVTADPLNELLAAWLGPPLGLASSWSLAQRSANDTAVAQMIDRFADRCGQEIRPFVFELANDGPLSWQLSDRQKSDIYAGWSTLVPVRDSFLQFMGAPPDASRRAEFLTLK